MSGGTNLLKSAFRLWRTENVPPSGANWPNKQEILDALTVLGIDIDSLAAGSFEAYATTTARDADTSAPIGTIGYVYRNNGSATDPANGFYQRISGGWEAAGWLTSIITSYIDTVLPYAGQAPIIVPDYGARGAIPTDQRYAGMLVWVVSDQRWFDLPADNLTNTGWKRPSWLVPLQQGTLTERNNRVGITSADVKEFTRFLQNDVFPNVLWEFRYSGRPSGAAADSPPLTQDDWVSIPQASDLIPLKISGFTVASYSGGGDGVVEATWAVTGTQPDTQMISWGSTSVTLDGDTRSYVPKDWAAVKDFFVSGNSIDDATDVPKWHTILAARRGVTSRFTARYSSDIRQPYRAGLPGYDLYLTVADNALPAGGAVGSAASKPLTAINGNNPIDAGAAYAFLNTGGSDVIDGLTMAGTIIDGTTTRHVTVAITNGAANDYTITQDAGLAAITLTGAVRFIPDVAQFKASSDNYCGVGNNIFYSGVPGPDGNHVNVFAYPIVDAFAAAADGNRFMTRDVLPDASWPADGTPVVIDGVTYTSQCFSAMNAWNTRNETVHPGSRPRSLPTSGFPNGRTLLKYLQDRANPAFSGNTADIAAGLTPREFRQNSDGSFDSLHPNLAGHVVIADFYEEALQTQVLPSPITASTVFTLTASGTIVNQVGFDTSSAVTTDSAVSPVTPGFTLPVVDQEARDDIEAIEAASPVGPLTSGVWRSTTGLPRLRLTGTGTVAIDARDSLGTVTADVVGPYTLTGETNRIEFPFFGSTTIEIRATITGSATAEII